MEPSVIGVRLGSAVVAPLVRKLFVTEGTGAGLVDRPVRISSYVSFRGEKRRLDRGDLARLAAELVQQALQGAGERPLPADEETAVAHALADTLYALGELDMTDVQAVELGHEALAARLRAASGDPARDLSFDAAQFYLRTLTTACLHILHFFSQRSSFVPRTLVEQSRRGRELIDKVDALLARTAPPSDAAFEQRYMTYVTTRHGHLTIYGIDLVNSPDRWPLDTAYLSLRALHPAADGEAADPDGPGIASAATALPAEQAFADHDRVLLRGVAGSGKTTLVQWLAVTAARGERGDRVPFVLPLRTLVRRPDGLPAPDAFLSAVRVPFHANQPDGWADHVLRAGRGLLLVDGIDEIAERERERTRRWLRDLLDVYPGNQWLVTSRPSAVREDWLASDGFTELALTPMSGGDVAAFVARWHSAARAGAPEERDRLDTYERTLLDAVRTKPDLARLATNPLMCGLICALHRDRRGYLPHGRQELYDAALSMLLARRDEERDMPGPDGVHLTGLPQIQLLQRLAHWLIRNNQSEMDRERAERIVADVLPSLPAAASQGDAPSILRYLLVRSGLLREPSVGTVEFVHRTFQDYLGAKAAVEDGDFGLLVRGAADEQWADVFRMAVAHARPRERADLLRQLMASADRLDGAARARVRLLALASLEHATELDPAVRKEVERGADALIPPRTTEWARVLASVGPLVLELLPGPEGLSDEEARAVVVTASLIGTEAAVPVLARFRSHPALAVRAQLAWTWYRFPTGRYGREVVAHLPEDELFHVAHSGEHLRFLRELGGRRSLHLVGDVDPAGLPGDVAELVVRANERLRDLRCLADLNQLTYLDLSGCPRIDDIAPLARLPLSRLSLDTLPGLERPDALSVLSGSPTLSRLDLGIALEAASLDRALPHDLPLRHLRLGKRATLHTGLRGLHRLAGLRQLSLAAPAVPLTDEDYEEMARHRDLEELRVSWQDVGRHGPTLPGVTSLRLYNFRGTEDLSGVRTLFPNLREVTINLAADITDVPDHVREMLPVTPAVVRTRSVV
ncbi:NACHT domain-containing protein [Streptomyces chromofuscus]|uniref:NACHT domain-containing protein n=1 Tax=Streptomyces chromofuscus TaxID=42881 RepID=A0A7M2T1M0_STRCW|nr:NACHT domain-containing protein [Streptomyces chromofuscus]QOV42214.1 NACHT domain-containing protein [Streptomyces chromofuscus]GGS84537.1 ATP-binding protein [Streptomyces chromofuscus]